MINSLYRGPYLSFVPEYLRDKEDFLVFLQLMMTEFDITIENIENFTDLVNPDKVPVKFMEALGSYVNFRYNYNADEDFNREILTRVHSIYEQRGTDASILMAAIHGDNPGWVGGDIFIPGYPISKDKASLVVARDSIFTHSRSRHSSTDVFSDGDTYRPGVIIIDLPYISREIIDEVTNVMPAGVRFKFFVNTTFAGNDGDDTLGKFGELSHYKCFRVVPILDEEKESDNAASNTEITIDMAIVPEQFNKAIFSTNVDGKRFRSGRIVVSSSVDVESYLGVSMLHYDILTKGFLDEDTSTGSIDLLSDSSKLLPTINDIFFRSTQSGIYSGKYKLGGSLKDVNEIPEYIENVTHPDVTGDQSESETVTDDGRYIISPTGEKLDIWSKSGSHHLHRNIDINDVDTTMDVFTEVRLTAVRSHSSSIRSSHGKASGILDHVISAMTFGGEINPYTFLDYASRVDEEYWYTERDEHLYSPARIDTLYTPEFEMTYKPM